MVYEIFYFYKLYVNIWLCCGKLNNSCLRCVYFLIFRCVYVIWYDKRDFVGVFKLSILRWVSYFRLWEGGYNKVISVFI